MKYYKDNNGKVFAYKDDGSQDDLVGDKILLSQAEIDKHTEKTKIKQLPDFLTMRQTRLALLQNNLLSSVEQNISTMPKNVQIEWEYATTVEKENVLVATLATSLGLTSSQVDDLFVLGATL
jgi:hypothetical protein